MQAGGGGTVGQIPPTGPAASRLWRRIAADGRLSSVTNELLFAAGWLYGHGRGIRRTVGSHSVADRGAVW